MRGRIRKVIVFFFLMIRRPPRSTLDRSSAASDVYKRQVKDQGEIFEDIYSQILRDLELNSIFIVNEEQLSNCLLYTSPSPRDRTRSRMPSSA